MTKAEDAHKAKDNDAAEEQPRLIVDPDAEPSFKFTPLEQAKRVPGHRQLVQDSKQHQSFWTKPRPSVFVLLFVMGSMNFFCGAKFFYDLGITYKERGWTGASRFFMQLASFSNPLDPSAGKAQRYMKARLPKHDISQEDQGRNIDGYNLDDSGRKDEAIKVFTKLIADCPNFEWPYNNLANIRLERGEVEEARRLCEEALKINPDYANAHMTLADALRAQGRADLAEKHDKLARELLKDIP